MSLSNDFQTFLNRLQQFKRLDRIVINECHVILNRSQTFRKNLRRLGDLIGKKTQIVLLTATLPPRYESKLFDILYLLLDKAFKYRLSSNRSNIRYSVRRNQSNIDVLETIRSKSIQYSNDRVLVYARTIDIANSLAMELNWLVYYSKSSKRERTLRNFLDFNQTSQRIIGTTSLGLGLDAPNIRAIIHVDRSYTLYEYS